MSKLKLGKEDKKLILAYCRWANSKGFWPREYDVSTLIDNMNCDHRDLVEDYLSELKLKRDNNEL
jgi:hypothetical protein